MDDLQLYWTSIEYQYKKSSTYYGKLAGGFVFAFVQAFDARDALAKFDNRLGQEDVIPIYIDFISVYDEEMEWETIEQTDKFKELARQAMESTDVVLDDYYGYEPEVNI